MYPLLFSWVLRKIDPEQAHKLAFLAIRLLGWGPLAKRVAQFTAPRRDVSVETLGRRFPTPFGLAAGFDKDGKGVMGLAALGFGHIEVGTVTAIPQAGNPRPRLFRLIADRALVNRMGFNNRGAQALACRLKRLRKLPSHSRPIIGVNIGKSRVVAVEDALDDYRRSTIVLAPLADYLAVNVSSPNTPGLRGLQEAARLEPLLATVMRHAAGTPVLVKIAPDMSDEQALSILTVAVKLGLAGLIASNTTVSRERLRTPSMTVAAAGEGGLSGPPLAQRSLALLRLLRQVAPPDFCLVSVGGVRTPRDLAERLEAGATLVQGYTEFIYSGPLWPRSLNRGL